MELKALVAILLLAAPTIADTKPLTVPVGESWVFRLSNGEPVKARKVDAKARPANGEIMVTVRAFMGTALTAINGTGRGYTFKAELVTDGKATTARGCTLPKSRDPIFEQWPGKTADAVRVSAFKPAKDGNC